MEKNQAIQILETFIQTLREASLLNTARKEDLGLYLEWEPEKEISFNRSSRTKNSLNGLVDKSNQFDCSASPMSSKNKLTPQPNRLQALEEAEPSETPQLSRKRNGKANLFCKLKTEFESKCWSEATSYFNSLTEDPEPGLSDSTSDTQTGPIERAWGHEKENSRADCAGGLITETGLDFSLSSSLLRSHEQTNGKTEIESEKGSGPDSIPKKKSFQHPLSLNGFSNKTERVGQKTPPPVLFLLPHLHQIGQKDQTLSQPAMAFRPEFWFSFEFYELMRQSNDQHSLSESSNGHDLKRDFSDRGSSDCLVHPSFNPSIQTTELEPTNETTQNNLKLRDSQTQCPNNIGSVSHQPDDTQYKRTDSELKIRLFFSEKRESSSTLKSQDPILRDNEHLETSNASEFRKNIPLFVEKLISNLNLKSFSLKKPSPFTLCENTEWEQAIDLVFRTEILSDFQSDESADSLNPITGRKPPSIQINNDESRDGGSSQNNPKSRNQRACSTEQTSSLPTQQLLSQKLKDELKNSICRIQKEMCDGEKYLQNITTTLQLPLSSELFSSPIESLSHFLRSWTGSGSPSGFFLSTSDKEVQSYSPETFLKKCKDSISTQPIKGTAQSGKGSDILKNAQSLQEDLKEGCEQNLVTELLRNDLNQVCEVGSVKLQKQRVVQKVGPLLQMSSQLGGKIRADLCGLGELFQKTLPPGSVTGTPKEEVLRTHHESNLHDSNGPSLKPKAKNKNKIEKATANRKYYTGIIGVVSWDTPTLPHTSKRRLQKSPLEDLAPMSSRSSSKQTILKKSKDMFLEPSASSSTKNVENPTPLISDETQAKRPPNSGLQRCGATTKGRENNSGLTSQPKYSATDSFLHCNLDSLILIRSVFIDKKKGHLEIGIGAGITTLSESENEIREIELKAKSVLNRIYRLNPYPSFSSPSHHDFKAEVPFQNKKTGSKEEVKEQLLLQKTENRATTPKKSGFQTPESIESKDRSQESFPNSYLDTQLLNQIELNECTHTPVSKESIPESPASFLCLESGKYEENPPELSFAWKESVPAFSSTQKQDGLEGSKKGNGASALQSNFKSGPSQHFSSLKLPVRDSNHREKNHCNQDVRPSRLFFIHQRDSFSHNLQDLLLSLLNDNETLIPFFDFSPRQLSTQNPYEAAMSKDILRDLNPRTDALVLSPGPFHPKDWTEVSDLLTLLISDSENRKIPILGVCLGFQELLWALGVEVSKLPPKRQRPVHGVVSKLNLHPTRLPSNQTVSPVERADLVSRSFHTHSGQAVFFNSLRAKPSAAEKAGFEVLETYRHGEITSVASVIHKNLPWFGTQYHLESLFTSSRLGLLNLFLSHWRERRHQSKPKTLEESRLGFKQKERR